MNGVEGAGAEGPGGDGTVPLPFEARRGAEHGWYVVDPVGGLVHVSGEDGRPRAAFFGEDRAAAEAVAARLNCRHGMDRR
ncbi:hypothetical protein RM780_19070 [Streptomyces sp. DSM 44917]|uniref:Uncharacterized protein n=1 Tax=Streptomyces boetiae TaxID=3075541 RepID=A0ABU2LBT6_9ACTN|nr:hypothetical protein [Streptomyces sp. DSM 44917]MDT0309046.1 hypothetical protein [Streptomyces sp. DSM 44917]